MGRRPNWAAAAGGLLSALGKYGLDREEEKRREALWQKHHNQANRVAEGRMFLGHRLSGLRDMAQFLRSDKQWYDRHGFLDDQYDTRNPQYNFNVGGQPVTGGVSDLIAAENLAARRETERRLAESAAAKAEAGAGEFLTPSEQNALAAGLITPPGVSARYDESGNFKGETVSEGGYGIWPYADDPFGAMPDIERFISEAPREGARDYVIGKFNESGHADLYNQYKGLSSQWGAAMRDEGGWMLKPDTGTWSRNNKWRHGPDFIMGDRDKTAEEWADKESPGYQALRTIVGKALADGTDYTEVRAIQQLAEDARIPIEDVIKEMEEMPQGVYRQALVEGKYGGRIVDRLGRGSDGSGPFYLLDDGRWVTE